METSGKFLFQGQPVDIIRCNDKKKSFNNFKKTGPNFLRMMNMKDLTVTLLSISNTAPVLDLLIILDQPQLEGGRRGHSFLQVLPLDVLSWSFGGGGGGSVWSLCLGEGGWVTFFGRGSGGSWSPQIE